MNNQSQEQILVLPSAGNLLKRTFSVYKARLGTFLGIMILPAVFSFLPVIPFILMIILTIVSKFNFLLVTFLPVIIFFLAMILTPFWSLAVMLILLWSQVALIFAIKEREEKIGIVESFKKSWHKIISYVWISILTRFIILGGFLLFIIPGIISGIWFSFALYVLVSEDLKGMNSLFRSKQLVAGYWWKVLSRFLVMTILTILFFGLLFGILFGISVVFLPFLTLFIKLIISVIFTLFITLLFITPLSVTFRFLLYEDLKKTKSPGYI